METVSEEWRQVKGYEERFEVSSLGRIKILKGIKKSLIGAMKKPVMNRLGYMTVQMRTGIGCKIVTKTVHRIVAETFLGPIPAGMEVNHINGDKTDNRLVNLELVTRAQNMQHAYATGLLAGRQGVDHHKAKLTEEDVMAIRDATDAGVAHRLLARKYNVSRGTICFIAARKTWRHLPERSVA